MQPAQLDEDLTRLLTVGRGGPRDAADEASLLWGPIERDGWSLALHAYPDPHVFIVVVSGPPTPFEDEGGAPDLTRLEAVPGSPNPSPMLAADWVQCAETLLAQRASDKAPGAGRTLQRLLFSFARKSSIFFTGAGAAAGVAQVLACWAKESFPSMWIGTRTFGAPVIGTPDFHEYAELNLDEFLDWQRSLDARPEAAPS